MTKQVRKREKPKEWLLKAEHDLAAARRLAIGDDSLLNYAAFHCQQVAEKAVKAVLVSYGRTWDNRKGHNLLYLIRLAEGSVIDIGSRAHERNLLTPLAIQPRYPDYPLVTREEFEKFLENAEGFYKYVLSLFPPNVISS